ncbi:hypothetical protein N9C70_05275 [Flavobacteriales bacterium]|nr:hypothetical protein [Flavobacteriales bacterium]
MRNFLLLCLWAACSFANAQDDCLYQAEIVITTENWGEEVSWTLFDDNGDVAISGSNYESYNSYVAVACLNDACYTLELVDSFGDGWNGATISLNYADLGIMLGPLTIEQGDYASFSVGVDSDCNGQQIEGNGNGGGIADIWGCMDTNALNYDSTATVHCCCQYPTDCSNSNMLTVVQTGLGQDVWCDSLWSGPVAEFSVSGLGFWWNPSFQGANDEGQWVMEGCIADGCYNLFIAGANCSGLGTVEVLLNGETLNVYELGDDVWISEGLGINEDNCEFSTYGCTDPEAPNYDANANADDGSCLEPCDCPDVYDPVCGVQFNTGQTLTFNNMCELECAGAWFQWEGDCSDVPVYGCLDPEALNYDANANADSGWCIYLPECDGTALVTLASYGSNADSLPGDWFGPGPSAYFESVNGYYGNFVTISDEFGGHTSYGCLEDGCYNFYLLSNGWNGGTMEVTVDNGFNETYSLAADQFQAVYPFGINATGCEVFIAGCTDPEAMNYNNLATEDNGSCEYPFYCPDDLITGQLYVCTFSNGNEVALTILDSDGEVFYSQSGYADLAIDYIDVCIDPNECYTAIMSNNTGGNSWNGGYFWMQSPNVEWVNGSLEGSTTESIEFGTGADCVDTNNIWGCTDPEALNYNDMASNDDGSCVYDNTDPVDPIDCGSDNLVTGLFFQGDPFIDEVSWAVLDTLGNVLIAGNGSGPNGADTPVAQGCLPDGCYTVELYDSFGDGWGGGLLIITADPVALTFTLEEGEFASFPLELGIGCGEAPLTIWGCTDPGASNYSVGADADDGSCEYASCPLIEVTVMTYTLSDGNEVGWTIEGETAEDSVWFSSIPMGDFGAQAHTFCMAAGCYTMNLYDSAGDGWDQGWIEVWTDGTFMAASSYEEGGTNTMSMGIGMECGDAPDATGGGTNAGMSGWDDAVDFSIYPTPTGEIVNVLGEGFDNEFPVVVRIKDMMGKLIAERTVLPGEGKSAWQFDVRDWPVGIYTAEGIQGTRVALGKVMVAR